jgi:Fe-S cluster biosynthesis and repair protein YggX
VGDIPCTRCGQRRAPLGAPPFRDSLGERIQRDICSTCWDEWLTRQMQLINHYALDVRTPEARAFLRKSVEAFLFGAAPGGRADA